MPRTRPPYPPEVRRRIVELAAEGRTAHDLAQEFEPCYGTIRSWILKAGLDDPLVHHSPGDDRDGSPSDDDREVARLRRENAVLREELDILAKAAAWFAQETVPMPKRRSSS